MRTTLDLPENLLNEAMKVTHTTTKTGVIIKALEELEAIDWYNQRVDACKDNELKAILAHNRDEEKEHAAMVLEWIRRKDRAFDKELKDYLFTEKSITHE